MLKITKTKLSGVIRKYVQEHFSTNCYHRKIPLNILTTDANGKSTIDRSIVLSEREATYKIDTSRPYKINAGTSGVCQYMKAQGNISLIFFDRSCILSTRACCTSCTASEREELSFCCHRSNWPCL